MFEDFELESRKIEYDINEYYFDNQDIIESDVPEVDFDYEENF